MGDFPFENITKEQRDSSFMKLCNLIFDDKEKLHLRRDCNNASNYYFQKYRLKTRKSSKYSPVSAWNNKEEREKIKKITRRRGMDISNPNIRRTLKLYYGCVGQFRPDVAVHIYQKFKATDILDFSAGWGDRCIAAISQKIKYTGIDSNVELKTPYKKMINYFKGNEYITMIYDRSENVIPRLKKEYDLVFTSPPYYNKEKYNGMHDYKTYDNFIDEFFIPVVVCSWEKLKTDGVMALNIPDNMLHSLVENIPVLKSHQLIKIPLQKRPSEKTEKFENIYYWVKSKDSPLLIVKRKISQF